MFDRNHVIASCSSLSAVVAASARLGVSAEAASALAVDCVDLDADRGERIEERAWRLSQAVSSAARGLTSRGG